MKPVNVDGLPAAVTKGLTCYTTRTPGANVATAPLASLVAHAITDSVSHSGGRARLPGSPPLLCARTLQRPDIFQQIRTAASQTCGCTMMVATVVPAIAVLATLLNATGNMTSLHRRANTK